MQNETTLVAQLDSLLDEERALLLNGKLDKLPELLDRKRTLVERLDSPPQNRLVGPTRKTDPESRASFQCDGRHSPCVRAVGDAETDTPIAGNL